MKHAPDNLTLRQFLMVIEEARPFVEDHCDAPDSSEHAKMANALVCDMHGAERELAKYIATPEE